MKRSELVKILKKHGCKFVEHGGNHDKFYSPITQKVFLFGDMLRIYHLAQLKQFSNRQELNKESGRGEQPP